MDIREKKIGVNNVDVRKDSREPENRYFWMLNCYLASRCKGRNRNVRNPYNPLKLLSGK